MSDVNHQPHLPPPQPPKTYTVTVGSGAFIYTDVTGWGFNGDVFSFTRETGQVIGVSVDRYSIITIDPQ